tara:strand:- start:11431 stop:12774 length:1344 start_codon:yes stop_codon:yes gene_type:complete
MEDAAREATNVSARILASRTYQKALNTREKSQSQSRSIKYRCENASKAEDLFRSATDIANSANIILEDTIKNRRSALSLDGHIKYSKNWDKAERKFLNAIKAMENYNIKKAEELNRETSSEFSEIELLVIKDIYLNEARLNIYSAQKEKADRFAPITLSQARDFLRAAESQLDKNRYENQSARDTAEKSIERSNHAIFLTKLIQSIDKDKFTIEQLIIQSEKNLEKIANSADIYPLMTNGYKALTDSLSLYIDNIRRDKSYLEQDQRDNLIQISDMEEEIRNLDKMLGGVSEERESLIQRIEAQARIKEQYERVEKIFLSEEARVLRENNNVILRLIGLTFESNESKIMTKNIPLLTKVEKAIDVYPKSEIIIEGHTDSQGDDQFNQNLSQERADSVKQYMINAMLIPNYRIIATGFGETRPIANNETALGRQKNRRIDIVISSIME